MEQLGPCRRRQAARRCGRHRRYGLAPRPPRLLQLRQPQRPVHRASPTNVIAQHRPPTNPQVRPPPAWNLEKRTPATQNPCRLGEELATHAEVGRHFHELEPPSRARLPQPPLRHSTPAHLGEAHHLVGWGASPGVVRAASPGAAPPRPGARHRAAAHLEEASRRGLVRAASPGLVWRRVAGVVLGCGGAVHGSSMEKGNRWGGLLVSGALFK